MISSSSISCPFLLSYDWLSKKPLLFISFTGLTVQEFDDIYEKNVTKRYTKHEIQRLSKRKKDKERSIGAGRHFKLDVKNRFLMLLVYYRLYITYTLSGFLFDLDQSNVCRDIQKIERLIRQCTNSAKDIPNNQKVENSGGSREIFSRPSCIYRLSSSRYQGLLSIRKKENVLFRQEEKAYRKESDYG